MNRIKFVTTQNQFNIIPGSPISYWVSEKSTNAFRTSSISSRYVSGGRNKTHNNEKYVRSWWEIMPSKKWYPYANGGDYRKWYGNNIDVVDWSDEAKSFYDSHGGLLKEIYWAINGITWNDISQLHAGYRAKLINQAFSSCSPTIIRVDSDEFDFNLLGFLNSKVSDWINAVTNSTLHTLVGNVLTYPDKTMNANSKDIVKENINFSKKDWDSFETSWDFKKHPLI